MKKLILGMAAMIGLYITAFGQTTPAVGRENTTVTIPTPPVPLARFKVRPRAMVAPSASVGTSKVEPTSIRAPRVASRDLFATTNKGHKFSYSGSATTVGSNISGGGTQVYVTDDKQDQTDDPMKTKTFSKSFNLDRNDKVNLSNIYGSITVKTWEKNEIKVDADIKAYATTETDAEKLLEGVNIKATKEGDQITCKTIMEERNGNWGRGIFNGKKWRREVKVYITVYMPKNNALNVVQEHGSIILDDYNGPTSLKVQYGSINGGDLNNANNYISAQYANTRFKDINQARIRQEYGGGLTIGTIGTIDLESEYAAVNINTIKNSGNIKQEYGGGINIVNANNLTLNSHFIRTKINTLTGNVVAKLEHGGLVVENVKTSVKNFNLTSEYATINLGFDVNYNANFTVSTEYAPFRYGTTVTAKKMGDEKGYRTSNSYSGQIGKGGSSSVTVKSEYGSVTFK